jgi:hypothetical protein
MRRTTALALASTVAIAGSLALAAPASAKNTDSKQRGSCSASSDYVVKVKDRKGGARVDFWVKTDTTSESWKLVLTQNGATVVDSTKQTRASDDNSNDDSLHAAEVKWRTFLPSGSGPLAFTATGGGETCTVTLR